MPKSAVSEQHDGTENSVEERTSDHCFKNEVLALNYMKRVKLFMDCLGQYPSSDFGVNTRGARLLNYYRWLLITSSVMCEILCVAYTWNRRHELDFFNLGHLYGSITTTAVLIQRLLLYYKKSYRSLLRKFVTEYHLLLFESESDFAKMEHLRIDKYCQILKTTLSIQLVFGVITYNLTPVYNNWSAGMYSATPPPNRTLDHSVYFELPFDYSHEVGVAYLSMVIFTFYPVFNVTCGFGCFDLIINIVVFHVWGHFNVLANKLETFPKLGAGRQSKEAMEEYNKRAFLLLKNIIQRYQIIKQFVSDVSDGFETTLCASLCFQQLSGCVLLLECSVLTPEAFGQYLALTLFVFQQLVQTCLIFEQINSKSDKLASQVYDIPWEDMDVSNRKIVLVLLRDVQNTLSVKALGVLPVGVMTMSAIIRTSISYFIMLKTLAQ